MNYMDIAAIRQGKVFDIELKDVNEAKSKALLEEIARKILANPIIEEYAIEWE
jgi:phosphoribosylformylglycinamidine synthase